METPPLFMLSRSILENPIASQALTMAKTVLNDKLVSLRKDQVKLPMDRVELVNHLINIRDFLNQYLSGSVLNHDVKLRNVGYYDFIFVYNGSMRCVESIKVEGFYDLTLEVSSDFATKDKNALYEFLEIM